MTGFFLPEVLMARAAKRLRAMADAIEGGMGMTDVAAQFRIPVRTLRRVATPQPRKPPGYKKRAISQIALARAAARIREGASYRTIALELGVSVSTLIKAMTRIGVTINKVRDASRADMMALAVELYKQGLKVSEICERTRIPAMTLYKHLRKRDDTVLRQVRAPHAPVGTPETDEDDH